MTTGLFIGRFQPFHNAHLADVKMALGMVTHLYIGIGSSQECGTEKNPFSVAERKDMISSVLKEEGITSYSFIEVEDCESDDEWVSKVESLCSFSIVFTGNEWTEKCFKNKGYEVVDVDMLPGISSTLIRERMKKGGEWKHMVPKSVWEDLSKRGI